MKQVTQELHHCNDDHCLDEKSSSDRIALAKSICDTRGVRLTPARAQVLALLWDSSRPLGAYELIDALTELNGRKVNPPTVYRALEFLIDQEFVTKIESLNAYVPCPHPERSHICLFFICSGCGASTEIEDPRIEQLLTEDASTLGFNVTHPVLELQGTCADCATAGTQ